MYKQKETRNYIARDVHNIIYLTYVIIYFDFEVYIVLFITNHFYLMKIELYYDGQLIHNLSCYEY